MGISHFCYPILFLNMCASPCVKTIWGQRTWRWSQLLLAVAGVWSSLMDLATSIFHHLGICFSACMKLWAQQLSWPEDGVNEIVYIYIYTIYIDVVSFMVAAHQNWDRLACMLAKVSRVSWKMFHYSSKSPKPHYAYANSRVIHRLDKGKLSNWKGKAAKEGRPIIKTCETYTNSRGEKCYKGTTWLKQTEILDAQSHTEFEIVSLHSYMVCLLGTLGAMIRFLRNTCPWAKGVSCTFRLGNRWHVWRPHHDNPRPERIASSGASCHGLCEGHARKPKCNLWPAMGQAGWSLHLPPPRKIPWNSSWMEGAFAKNTATGGIADSL